VPSYIFIGGLPRTGSDLLRNIINKSKGVAVCGETDFFGDQSNADLLRAYLVDKVFSGFSRTSFRPRSAPTRRGYGPQAAENRRFFQG
jgi:hypothetical protein